MPKRRAQDVVHAVMTDHYIQRSKPADDLAAPLAEAHPDKAYRGDIVIYDEAHLASGDSELYRAVAQARQETNPELGIANLPSAIKRLHPTQPEFYFELGRAYRIAGQHDQAIQWLNEAIHRRPGFGPALKELARALTDSGQLARAAEILERNGRDARVLTELGKVYLQQGKLDQAARALQRPSPSIPKLPRPFTFWAWCDHIGPTRVTRRSLSAKRSGFNPILAEAQTNL